MLARRKLLGVVVLVGVPLLVAILWVASGRGMFTQHHKVVQAIVRDELFGDTRPEERLDPGPVFGYYVGADLLILATVAAGAGGTAWWLLNRRRARRNNEGSTHGT